jgi:hypothetical protein
MTKILAALPDAQAENALFENVKYVPGRRALPDGTPLQPDVCLTVYEERLDQIRRIDPARYARMHKGTPFYMMGWLAYEVRDYERAAYYMDAAMSEDVHNHHAWQTAPAASFLFLDTSNLDAAAHRVTVRIRLEVDAQLTRYRGQSSASLTTDGLVNQFIRSKAQDANHRSIVTALLTLMLEGRNRIAQIERRSTHGGTLEPFLTHLFKGGLVFESIMKASYGTPGGTATLGDYLGQSKARSDLGISTTTPLYPGRRTFVDVVNLLPTWRSEAFAEKVIAIAYGVRNTSGHDLGWQDVLTGPVYGELYESLLDAIFWVIERKY